MRQRTFWLLLCLFLSVACFSGYQVLRTLGEYRAGETAYSELEQFVTLPSAPDETVPAEIEETPAEPAWPEVDFAELAAVNPDVVAWLYGPDTGISYPVVQGEDNEYYLHHTFEKKENFSGAIFMDITCRPDFSSDNSILFGHNLKTGEMFGELKKLYDTDYNEEADYRKHPVIWVVTPDAAMEYRIFAAREISVEKDTDVYMVDFAQEEEYQAWMQKQKEASMYETDTDISSYEPMLTLSTCTSDTEDGRFVVQAVRIQRSAQ